MRFDNSAPFPREVLRDLLGITRALYRAAGAESPPDIRTMEALEEIGKELKVALELAAKCEPGTMGRRAAWDKAERSTVMLGTFVAESALVAPAIRATMARIKQH